MVKDGHFGAFECEIISLVGIMYRGLIFYLCYLCLYFFFFY